MEVIKKLVGIEYSYCENMNTKYHKASAICTCRAGWLSRAWVIHSGTWYCPCPPDCAGARASGPSHGSSPKVGMFLKSISLSTFWKKNNRYFSSNFMLKNKKLIIFGKLTWFDEEIVRIKMKSKRTFKLVDDKIKEFLKKRVKNFWKYKMRVKHWKRNANKKF